MATVCIAYAYVGEGEERGTGWEGAGRGSRASRESGFRFQTAINQKRLEITRSIWYTFLTKSGTG